MFTFKHHFCGGGFCFFFTLICSIHETGHFLQGAFVEVFSPHLTHSLLLLLCSLTSASSRFTEWRSSSSAHCSQQKRRWGLGRRPGPRRRGRPAPHCPGLPTAARSPWSKAHPKTVCGTVMGRWSPTPTFTCSEWLCCSGLGGDNDGDDLWW